MPRIVGIDIPNEKTIGTALTYIYGIGDKVSLKILSLAKIDPATRAKNLTEEDTAKIRQAIEDLQVSIEGELKRTTSQNIKRLMDIRCFRGIRHQRKLPVRGQNTRTNARTKRGKRATVGGMKKILQKT
ncbi:MAG: 30S ribosomal protein S13 [Patescibacteria group bacterium]|nr:30S ribosomal protein S13 [Patescibacteria group bacterium]